MRPAAGKRKDYSKVEEGDQTPMIDMVFQLIAFFMVIVNFTEAEQDERVKLPSSELARPPDQPLEQALTVNIGVQRERDGTRVSGAPWEIYMAGRTVGNENNLGELTRILEAERQVVVAQRKNPRDVVVIIRADSQAPTGLVQGVIQKAQEAQFEQFALRAEEEGDY